MKRKLSLLAALAITVVMTGCMAANVRPGSVKTPLAEQTQPHNPKDSTLLKTESTKTVEFTLPAGSVVTQPDPLTGKEITFRIPTNTPVRIGTVDKVDSEIGGADFSIGKTIAKLKSLKWVQGVGILVFLIGVATFAWPPARAVIGSVTTSAMIAGAGLALIILPIVIVGNELLILCGCLGAAAVYFFVHRYGKKSGEVEVLKKWVDKNKDGKVDPGEMV